MEKVEEEDGQPLEWQRLAQSGCGQTTLKALPCDFGGCPPLPSFFKQKEESRAGREKEAHPTPLKKSQMELVPTVAAALHVLKQNFGFKEGGKVASELQNSS